MTNPIKSLNFVPNVLLPTVQPDMGQILFSSALESLQNVTAVMKLKDAYSLEEGLRQV